MNDTMSEETEAQPLGEICFHQACQPSLDAGIYTLTVTQKLSVSEGEGKEKHRRDVHEFGTGARFQVSGPRFFLKPSDIYAVYPPAGMNGGFENTLPHVVFTRRTLPWERGLNSKEPPNKTAPVPWLALLLLEKDDFEDKQLPKVTACKVGALLSPTGSIPGPDLELKDGQKNEDLILGPDLELEEGQKNEDLCNVIDLPINVFAKIAPTLDDLPLLAHVREVSTEGKETLSLKQDGWFSTIVCHRFPATSVGPQGEPSLVCLVSVEGFAKQLKALADGKTAENADVWEKKTKIRLAVLASWRFTCQGKDIFKTALAALDCTSPFRMPLDAVAGDDAGAKTVRRAFELGYTGLKHTTRLGEKTVSWYRGPLVPLTYYWNRSYPFIPCADRALSYDPDNGLFATEYAAAYELGRLMGLQNRGFASAMYRFRQRSEQDKLDDLRLALLKDKIGVDHAFEDEVVAVFSRLSRESPGAAEAPEMREADPSRDLPPLPKEVTQFIARAMLLYGVPFQYLVPDGRMLPSGSIRFFYLDPGWISMLVQGATSVGRIGEEDTDIDERLRAHVQRQAMEDCARVRDSVPPERTVRPAAWPLTGFLLRSELAEGWQGLEMLAEGTNNLTLTPLRIDRLCPDVLLCIFNGAVTKLTVRQPREGLHFGLSVGEGNYQRKSLRKVTGASGGRQPGDQLPTRDPVIAPMRSARCIHVSKLAENIKQQLANLDSPCDQVTSAELAVQLIESPGLATFVLNHD